MKKTISKSWTSAPESYTEPALPVSSRAVRYGDGVFVTLRLEQGILLDAALQMHRLRAAAADIGLRPPEVFLDGDGLGALVFVLERLGADSRPHGVARVQWHAGPGPRGYYRTTVEAEALVEFSAAPAPRHVAVARLPPSAPIPALPHLKSCSALAGIVCQRAAAELGADEGIRCLDGILLETATSNVLWLEGDRLCTADSSLPLYAGSVRRRTIDAAREGGLDVVEGEFSADRLDEADTIFLANAVRGLEAVASLDGRALREPGKIGAALIEAVAARRAAAGIRLWWPGGDAEEADPALP